MPAVQEHGCKAAASTVPGNIEPALRYLCALLHSFKIVCPNMTIEFSFIPEGVDHARLRRAQPLADSAVELPEDMDWDRQTLRVRTMLRDIVLSARFWAKAEELELAERLVKEAEDRVHDQASNEVCFLPHLTLPES